MLTQIPENIEDDNDNSNSELPPETIRYLSECENKLYADIAARRRIDSGLLFLSCQISSCSLSWLLFHLQVTLLIIQVSSMVVSLLPGLIDIGDSFNFQISSEQWKLDLGHKPIIGLTKLAIGGAVSASGTSKITSEILQTQQAIANTYHQIKAGEGLSFQLPNITFPLLIALAGIAILGFIKLSKNKDINNDENY
jgi:hypothetical protein